MLFGSYSASGNGLFSAVAGDELWIPRLEECAALGATVAPSSVPAPNSHCRRFIVISPPCPRVRRHYSNTLITPGLKRWYMAENDSQAGALRDDGKPYSLG